MKVSLQVKAWHLRVCFTECTLPLEHCRKKHLTESGAREATMYPRWKPQICPLTCRREKEKSVQFAISSGGKVLALMQGLI